MEDTNKLKLTSVKVNEELFQEFKVQCVRHKFSFQKLADRTLFLFLTDEKFRDRVINQNDIRLKD